MKGTTDAGERILDAAARLFARRGYSGTSTRAIAREAGVNEVTVFRRFDSKAGVLRELGRRIEGRTAGRAAPQPEDRQREDSSDVRATLLDLARREVSSAMENGGLALRLAFEAQSVREVEEVLGDSVPANLAALSGYLREQQAAGRLRRDVDPGVIAEAFFALTSSYVMYRMVTKLQDAPADAGLDTSIDQLLDLFWAGAAPQEETK